MVKKKIHLYVCLSILIIFFILGTFLDKSFTNTFYSPTNFLALFLSAFGLGPGYALYVFLSGALFRFLKQKYKSKRKRIPLQLLTFLPSLMALLFAGREIFAEDLFKVSGNVYIVVGIACYIPLYALIWFAGFKITKNNTNPKMLKFTFILLLLFLFLFLFNSFGIKNFYHRPRPRSSLLQPELGISFIPWYQRFTSFKDYIGDTLTKEEFKSFPSGHASGSMLFLVLISIIPLYSGKFEKYEVLFIYIGFIFYALVSFSRIVVGAHYLSDISAGGLLILIPFIFVNELSLKTNLITTNK